MPWVPSEKVNDNLAKDSLSLPLTVGAKQQSEAGASSAAPSSSSLVVVPVRR